MKKRKALPRTDLYRPSICFDCAQAYANKCAWIAQNTCGGRPRVPTGYDMDVEFDERNQSHNRVMKIGTVRRCDRFVSDRKDQKD